jgi:Tol biopolymer transport system component
MCSGRTLLPRPRVAALGLAILLPWCLPSVLRAATYPPELRFHTISTDRVSVHFHQGEEGMARQAAALATEILGEHTRRYRQRLGRVQIVLVDVQDDANGFATPLPYPFVTIQTAAPNGSDAFGNHEGWLRLALTHELAHIVHLEEGRGIWAAGRRLFGRAPFLFPNVFAMTWMVEGLATYEETRLTAFGRGRDPDSKMVLRMAALEDRFPKEDQAISALETWPGGQVPYLFGEGFLDYLSERSGADTIPRLGRQHATQIIPYLDGRTVGKVTGLGLHAQWKRWAGTVAESARREQAARSARGLTPSVLVTTRGIRQAEPRFSPDGSWIAYTSSTLTRFPELRLVRSDGSQDHRLTLRNGGSGSAWTPDGKALVYAELQVHRTFSVFGDLSSVDVASGRVRRLTRGLRALDPDVSPDGRTIVFARRLGDRSDLFTIGIDGSGLKRLTSSLAGVEWSDPRFDPRGGRIVAARLLPGGWLDVVLVDAATGAVEQLTHDRAKDVEPTWTPDGQAVVFRSDRDGLSNLYAIRLVETALPPDGQSRSESAGGGDHSLLRVTNVIGGAFDPAISPDGRSLAYSCYSSRGYDIALASFDLASAVPADPFTDPYPPSRVDPLPVEGRIEPYPLASLLLPRFWTPWFERTGDETRIGAATGGSDALFRHLWALQGTYGSESRRVNASGYYMYSRFRTTLLLGAQDTSDPVEDGLRRTRQLNLQASLPLRRTIRSLQTLSLTYRRRSERSRAQSEDNGGIETAWTLTSAKSYAYSISPTDGAQLRLAWLHEAKALGSDYTLEKLTADVRSYHRLLGERDVLAVRLGAGTTLGQRERQDTFAIGGYPEASLLDVFRTNPTVLRGYPVEAFEGRSYAVANLEYRFPLFSPQRGWRSLPVFLRHLRGAVFVDAGEAWGSNESGRFRIGDLRTAAGASLGVDTAIGFSLPATAEVAVAHGFAAQGDTRVYLRFALAF